ncbi:MAG: 23S rRNA (adenine(2030)-N(6))-methyltransferase RlmJ [Hyphomicrobiaceae bacterium]
MNYRHAFHAGNFADVLKHATLALVLAHLARKDTPFRVIDTHAGIGLYDLAADPARRTEEWRAGIGRLIGPDADPLPQAMADLLHPYLDAVRAENPSGTLRAYPGSPLLARHFLRPQDRLILNELHPEDAADLTALFARDKQTKVLQLDGWVALKALLPPRERRGAILIDPPFEQPGELVRLTAGLVEAVRRFATGIYLLWYPVKDTKPIQRFHRALAASGLAKMLCVELMIRAPADPTRLNGCGLVILNPPHSLAESLAHLSAFLAERLAIGAGAVGSVYWIVPEPHG